VPGLSGIVDVVVPAHNEEASIGACLLSLIAQRDVSEINVVVVANGCSDRTAEVARGLEESLRAAGHRLSVIELPSAGKARALNAAGPLLGGDIHVYLDADVVLSARALAGLHAALARRSAALLASPLQIPLLPAGRLARSYAEVWMELPSVAREVVGLGCYAVNPAGRARWSEMPELVADDAFVRARFSADERLLLDRDFFLYLFPAGRDLLGVLARWRDGNRELTRLNAGDDPRAQLPGALAAIARRPRLWRHLLAFALLSAAVRLGAGRSPAWFRASRALAPASVRGPRLWVAVLAGPSPVEDAFLASLAGALAGVEYSLTVLGDSALPAPGDPHTWDLALIVAPGHPIDPRELELLLMLARRLPAAGVYVAGTRAAGMKRSRVPAAIRDARSADGSLLLIGATAWGALGAGQLGALRPRGRAALLRRARRLGFRPLALTLAVEPRSDEPGVRARPSMSSLS